MKHRIIMIGENEFRFVLIHVIEGNKLAILICVSCFVLCQPLFSQSSFSHFLNRRTLEDLKFLNNVVAVCSREILFTRRKFEQKIYLRARMLEESRGNGVKIRCAIDAKHWEQEKANWVGEDERHQEL